MSLLSPLSLNSVTVTFLLVLRYITKMSPRSEPALYLTVQHRLIVRFDGLEGK